jgi:hypothetical protein
MQIWSHSYHCGYFYIYLICFLCYNIYICSIFLSGFIDVSVQTILKCSNGRTDFIPEMLNQMGNSIEDYRAAIGLFNTKKRCMYGLVNFRAESYQQIMLINLQCSALVLFLFLLQSTIPEINIVFLLYVLQFILIIGDVETHLGPGTYNSNPPVNITNNNVDKYISMCNINIRSVRNKLHFLLSQMNMIYFASQNSI